MRTEKNPVVHVHLREWTCLDYHCDCIVDGDIPSDEELQDLADTFYDNTEGDDFKENPYAWDREYSGAELSEDPNSKPTFRARLVDGEWEIKEVQS
jgi:hypothetical protein